MRFPVKKLVAVSPVVEAWVMTEEEAKRLEVKVLRKRREEDPREKVSVIDGVVLPAMTSLSVGVVVPIPTFPFASIEKSEAPVEEETLNGLTPAAPWTLKDTVEDVALIPATVPLSRRVDTPRVVAESHRVANPVVPPATPVDITPRLDVATHLVVVPVVWRIIPRVPEALVESKRAPRRVRLVVVAVVAVRLVMFPVVA